MARTEMGPAGSKNRILVVSARPGLADITRQAVGGTAEVEYASGQDEARSALVRSRPDVIILGQLEPAGSVEKFCRELKQGWISRHSSLIVVEPSATEDGHHIISDENLEVGIGEYNFLTGSAAPLIPGEFLLPRLREKILERLNSRKNGFKDSVLDPAQFCLVWEQIPGIGAFETRQETVLENARKAARGGKVCSVSITDNPGGNPAIATDILCSEIRKIGIEPLVHIAFRDRSRNQCESLLYQLAALDINNVLILTGDYPSHIGFRGTSRPVFDLDAVNGLKLVSEMNAGMEHEIMRKMTRLAPTDFFAGAAFSPFKQEEAEVMGQFYKLKKKIAAGAQFILTQVGYDVRKWQELQLWLKEQQLDTPVLATIYVLTAGTAVAMHANRVPGCVVTDDMLKKVMEESQQADKGRQARMDRAAKMFAIAKGLGFAGAVISGQGVPYETVEYIVQKGESLAPNWPDLVREFDFPQQNGFYYFEKESKSGLNAETPAPRRQKPAAPPIYYLSRAIHASLFEPGSPLFHPMTGAAKWIDKHPVLNKSFASLEFWTKAILYGCQNCGDCALFDVAYLCPVSQCPKNQRNGPCGGSFEGWCEVYPGEKKCIWVRAYRRLKAQKREGTIPENLVPPNDWGLWQTSSWLNYFCGRDHISRRLGAKAGPPEGKQNETD
jgi:methylenetetrahydrofolate reductase (NADPH)